MFAAPQMVAWLMFLGVHWDSKHPGYLSVPYYYHAGDLVERPALTAGLDLQAAKLVTRFAFDCCVFADQGDMRLRQSGVHHVHTDRESFLASGFC